MTEANPRSDHSLELGTYENYSHAHTVTLHVYCTLIAQGAQGINIPTMLTLARVAAIPVLVAGVLVILTNFLPRLSIAHGIYNQDGTGRHPWLRHCAPPCSWWPPLQTGWTDI